MSDEAKLFWAGIGIGVSIGAVITLGFLAMMVGLPSGY